ncbi:MBOAT family protein [Mucilaginibacter limnophilus]|uniref:MBOAT family protein n=1 Tax=Mucilaginibacter limnophilus TaxID=1932778 RepID=A0A3S2VPK2_9SPHI|nr:MBOAT family O-acyltransferase [Mucilaginibacter limnophilus]RVU02367.1 MBOAT family protein [Mucilaginibacter limnophilus]
MLFNSLQFLLFFCSITSLYFLLAHKYRWLLLLLASCYFYMAFIPKYIIILGFTIIIDYFAGLLIENANGKRRKIVLIISLISNISILALFKYFNFLNMNLTEVLAAFGKNNPMPFLRIALPIGLSFHTFQAMSYTIEVYRGKQKAERHFGIYALYVMFYPQLVAGPIERPQNLLHQFREKHYYNADNMRRGLLQMAFGLFKKVVIADRLAIGVDYSFAHYQQQTGLSLLIASLLYSFQIYCDFSGYSDMAIGAARCMGFKLMTNFNTPYLARSVGEFWKRWHISLSTWFKDYLYIPLGGSRVPIPRFYLNLLIVFLISGLWHGANWTFVVWGGLNGLMVIIEHAFSTLKFNMRLPRVNGTAKKVTQILLTFLLISLVRVFFRSPEISQAGVILSKIFNLSFIDAVQSGLNTNELLFSLLLITILILVERHWPRLQVGHVNKFAYACVFTLLLFVCYFFGVFNYKQFIYFQF